MIRPVLLSALALFATTVHAADARAQARAIQARDGDIVMVPADATITVARAVPGRIKVAVHEQGRVLVVLLDQGPQPDGIVDSFYRFDLPLLAYPPEYAFDGAGTFEEYDMLGNQRGLKSYGLVLPQGRVLIRSSSTAPQAGAVPEHIAAFQFKGHSSRTVRATFDDAEREALTGVSPTGIQARVQLGVSSGSGGLAGAPTSPDAPVRVGGSVPQPVKVKDVAPVMPDVARQAHVHGIVIVEITIDTQGRVSHARILRSIPLLDQAALDAVRQWEYTPTYVDGQPRPVIMTVTVPFQGQE